jgi:hypothetical protein
VLLSAQEGGAGGSAGADELLPLLIYILIQAWRPPAPRGPGASALRPGRRGRAGTAAQPAPQPALHRAVPLLHAAARRAGIRPPAHPPVCVRAREYAEAPVTPVAAAGRRRATSSPTYFRQRCPPSPPPRAERTRLVPPPRTERTRLVPLPVLNGHAAPPPFPSLYPTPRARFQPLGASAPLLGRRRRRRRRLTRARAAAATGLLVGAVL